MKIFLSHQKADSRIALSIQSHLKSVHDIDCYLDVIDVNISQGEDIAEHVRSELSKCTQLLAVVSESTKMSWWVPWEIGVATEKDYPLATFGDGIDLPTYLKKWPYLRNMSDLDKYAEASREARRRRHTASMESDSPNVVIFKNNSTKYFYRVLREKLGR